MVGIIEFDTGHFLDNIVHLFPEKETWNCLKLNLKLTIKVIGRERQKCHKPELGGGESVGTRKGEGEVFGSIERKGGLGH